MFQTALDFVTSKWALLTTSGKTTFCIGVAVGVIARSFV